MNRTHTLLILLALCLSLLAACGDSNHPHPPDTSSPLINETETPVRDIAIVQDGVANYTVVRPENANQNTIDAAVLVAQSIKEYTGIFPKISTDWTKRGEEPDAAAHEILIGNTLHPESAQALEGIPYGDYIITAIGNKIVINAWSQPALDRAISEFTVQLIKTASDGSFSLPSNIRMTGTDSETANALPFYEGGTFSTVYHAGDDNQLLLIRDTTREAYDAYCAKLVKEGFSLYTENEITDNKFATYITDDYVINAGYYDYATESRIIIEPRSTLPALSADNQYTKVMDPSFAMLGLEYMYEEELAQNGLCFIWQLADGSYIIADGGFNRARDAKALYDYMYKHAPDKNNITIAAWIFTHSHGDHSGAYFAFSETYANRVTLECVIGNFPSDEAREEGGLGTEGNLGHKIMKYLDNYQDAEFIKTHVGHKFYIRDAEIEILYTLESFAPGVLSYFNTSSLIFTMKIGGQQFLILGDASNDACTITSQMYGDYLKSDIIHAAHHGYTTGSSAYQGVTAVYDLAASPVVLWPLGALDYAGMNTRAQSLHLQELGTTKEIFVAGSRDIRFTLPYTVGTSGYESIIK